MFLDRIQVYNFRNLCDATINFSPGLNLIIGRNGQGKTNLLEAVHLLSFGRSFRTSQAKELLKDGRDEWSLIGSVVRHDGELSVEILCQNGKTRVLVNGKSAKSRRDLFGKFCAVTFSPEDLEIIRGEPSCRRNFLDQLLLQSYPQLSPAYEQYFKGLKNKNILLKEGAPREKIDPWNTVMAREQARIYPAKKELVTELSKEVADNYRLLSGSPAEVGLDLKNTSENDLESLLGREFNRERAAKRALFGMHRDDLQIWLNGRLARSYASQGESRTLALALKLSAARILERISGEKPTILLDDVVSELDSDREKNLLTTFLNTNNQIIVTGTRTLAGEAVSNPNQRIFLMSAGQLSCPA